MRHSAHILCCLINKRDNSFTQLRLRMILRRGHCSGRLEKSVKELLRPPKKSAHMHMTPPRALRFISRVVRVSLLSILFKPLYFASSFFSHTTQEFILEGKSLSGSAIELCSSVMSHQAQKKEHGKALRRIILERARREVKNVCEKYENKKKENAVFIRSLSLQFSRTFSTDFSFPPSMGGKRIHARTALNFLLLDIFHSHKQEAFPSHFPLSLSPLALH